MNGPFCVSCGGGSRGEVAQATAAAPAVTANLAAMLCYLPLLVLLFMVLPPYSKSKTVRFHALQCLGLMACMIFLEILSVVTSAIVAAVVPGWAVAVAIVFAVTFLAGLLLFVIGMVKAYRGQKLRVPLVSSLAEKFA
jgi:uncharacterized membrane protein